MRSSRHRKGIWNGEPSSRVDQQPSLGGGSGSPGAEKYQAVGLLCREALISTAQVVYDPQLHRVSDNVPPSATDAKGMLGAYIAAELSGGPNEAARRYAKASLELASNLQHHRTADYHQAALCAVAAASVVGLVAIMAGRRDREQ